MKIKLYTDNSNFDYFNRDADFLYKEAEACGEEDFIFDIEPNFSDGIMRMTIAEPDMRFEVMDEWIEFSSGEVLMNYEIRTNDIISMEVEF